MAVAETCWQGTAKPSSPASLPVSAATNPYAQEWEVQRAGCSCAVAQRLASVVRHNCAHATCLPATCHRWSVRCCSVWVTRNGPQISRNMRCSGESLCNASRQKPSVNATREKSRCADEKIKSMTTFSPQLRLTCGKPASNISTANARLRSRIAVSLLS